MKADKTRSKPNYYGLSVSQIACALVSLELRGTPVLTPQGRSAGTVWVACRASLSEDRHDVTSGEVEMALEYLADQGLVARIREEWECSPAKPQGYRWSKLADGARLKRFLSSYERRCSGVDCHERMPHGQPHGAYCSKRCQRKASALGKVVKGARP